MELTEEQAKKIQEFFNSDSFKNGSCPICGNDDFGFLNTVYKLTAFNRPNTPTTKQKHSEYPVIPIVCNKCGYTMFMNPLGAGIDLLKEEDK